MPNLQNNVLMKMQQSVDKTQMLLRLGNTSIPHTNSGSNTIVLNPELLVGQIQLENSTMASSNSGSVLAVGSGNTNKTGNKSHDYLFLIEFGAGALGGAVSRTA